jgi:hypothetical protein
MVNFSKIWNPPVYEQASIPTSGNLADVPGIADKVPVMVKVVQATHFRGPPRHNVRQL